MDYILKINNLSKSYLGFKLDNITISIPYGSIMGLVGPNGSGKSTIIKSILRLIKPDNGYVEIFGKQINNKNDIIIKDDISVVFDEINFYEQLTANKISKIMSNIYTKWDNELFFKYLLDFKLPSNKIIKEFSKGMKMKLSIAVALSHHPKLLILDESTNGLDPLIRNEILNIFLDFVKNKEHSILISSHITSDLERIADHITLLNNGKVIFSNKKSLLLNEYGIAKCSEYQFHKINKLFISNYIHFNEEYKILINNKNIFNKTYKNITINSPTIDDIILLYVKGEKNERISIKRSV